MRTRINLVPFATTAACTRTSGHLAVEHRGHAPHAHLTAAHRGELQAVDGARVATLVFERRGAARGQHEPELLAVAEVAEVPRATPRVQEVDPQPSEHGAKIRDLLRDELGLRRRRRGALGRRRGRVRIDRRREHREQRGRGSIDCRVASMTTRGATHRPRRISCGAARSTRSREHPVRARRAARTPERHPEARGAQLPQGRSAAPLRVIVASAMRRCMQQSSTWVSTTRLCPATT